MPVQLQVNGEVFSSMEEINEVFEDAAIVPSSIPKQVKLIKVNNQVRRLQTIIRDKLVNLLSLTRWLPTSC